jgi:hypothetical protein
MSNGDFKEHEISPLSGIASEGKCSAAQKDILIKLCKRAVKYEGLY